MSGRLTLAEAIRFVAAATADGQAMKPLSLRRYSEFWDRFERFARRAGVVEVAEVDREIVVGFVGALNRDGSEPAAGTRRLRASALRYLFRCLYRINAVDFDPTYDVTGGEYCPLAFRPLADLEIEECRAVALGYVLSERHPVIWGLAESGATTGEIGEVQRDDVDFAAGTVALGGGRTRFEREMGLTGWALATLRSAPDSAWSTNGIADFDTRRTSVSAVLRDILLRAGLDAPGIQNESIQAWAGLQVFQHRQRIEDVALHLGMRTLDQAARYIGHNWRADG